VRHYEVDVSTSVQTAFTIAGYIITAGTQKSFLNLRQTIKVLICPKEPYSLLWLCMLMIRLLKDLQLRDFKIEPAYISCMVTKMCMD
jgi:hypothetical protein